jgi:hypothetical protein
VTAANASRKLVLTADDGKGSNMNLVMENCSSMRQFYKSGDRARKIADDGSCGRVLVESLALYGDLFLSLGDAGYVASKTGVVLKDQSHAACAEICLFSFQCDYRFAFVEITCYIGFLLG